jgi:hypothetical protein
MLSKCKTLNPNPSTSPSTPKDKVQHLGLGYSSVGDVCSVCMRTCWIQSLEWKINNSHWNFLTDCFLLGLSPGSPTPAFFFFSPFAWRTLYTLKIHVHFLFPFLFFFSSGDWTQGLSFPLEPCPSPFFFFGRNEVFRASLLQSRHSGAWATPPVHFVLAILEMGSYEYLPGLTYNCDTSDLNFPGLVCFSDSLTNFSCLALNHNPSVSVSWLAGIKDMHHHAQPFMYFSFAYF